CARLWVVATSDRDAFDFW
nr:immunoglobulin heavy chain junction region [Macaca mulatta]MOW86887.1 immunoglobulin heavy chain junction region [Macaca mulatta]MOW87299.1 immunoglobulin heavy chain junction region [Macaca mulatta]MOW87479.1 immunoglobulin heavy chain junction region [Macaca mulatta]MOW87802.1 immunoglobulin heavy chain junction region [Macaca mulatta]